MNHHLPEILRDPWVAEAGPELLGYSKRKRLAVNQTMTAILFFFFFEYEIAFGRQDKTKLLFFVDKVLAFTKAFDNKLMALNTLVNITDVVYYMLARRVWQVRV